MLFNSLAFAAFAPSFLIVYFLLHGRHRLGFIVAASYFFYGWWDWRFVLLLIWSTVIDFVIGARLANTQSFPTRRWLLALSLGSNLGVLCFFKYFNFFTESFEAAAGLLGVTLSPPVLNIVLPVGISFYTFQTLSYTIDVYRREIGAERDFVRFAAYVSMFPQLVAGPIVRAKKLLPQLHKDHPIAFRRTLRGLEMIVWGFFLKLCLADNAAIVVDPRFEAPEAYGAASHFLGVLAFSFQIYGDFAGYSLIAIGFGRIMGFDFGVNFNRPYFAASFSDFWNRWHISLSTWLRDYLYITLGGNRQGTLFTFRNLVITMALGGLWHGAGWNFVLWGLLHGLFLVLQRLLSPLYWRATSAIHLPQIISQLLLVGLVFMLTTFAWIFFRADSLGDALQVITIIANMENLAVGAGEQRIAIIKTALIAAIVLLIDKWSDNAGIKARYERSLVTRVAGMAIVVWCILLLGSFEGTSFIYFQF